MKKIITIMLFMLCSLGINAQVHDSIYISNNPHGYRYLYHIDKNCNKATRIINEYELIDVTLTKFRNLKYCENCVTSNINDSIYAFIKNKNYIINDIYTSGYYQSKSATYRGVSLGLLITSAATAIIGSSIDFGSSDNSSKDACFIISGVLGVGAIITEICSIKYQYKSGKYLKISAGKITYNF